MSQVRTDQVVGTIIDGKYRVDSLMGQGGMGKVFRVTHLQLNKTFALKLMNFNQADSDPNRIARFKREAEALAKINHPNVVMVTDFGVTPDEHVPYIVMEYIEGMSLRDLLKNEGKLSIPQSIHISKQMCAGLHAAHLQGIIHRDLKPENIMIQQLVDGEMMARVLDFGIAKLLKPGDDNNENLTGGEELLGTLKYMTPEQFLGAPVDARADVFGICLITYEMLSGIVPPAVMSLSQPLTDLRPDTPNRLSDIVLRGLAQSPDDRQQTALELKREFEGLEHQALVDSVAEESLSGERSGMNNAGSKDRATGRHAPVPTGQNRRTSSDAAGHTLDTTYYEEPKKSRWPMALLVLLLLAGGGFGVVWRFFPEVIGNKPTKVAETAIPPLVSIKGGDFTMGTSRSGSYGNDFAQPEHPVSIAPFQVSKFLVTNRQYGEYIRLTGRQAPNHWQSSTPPTNILEEAVINVSWNDANDYCTWLTSQTGRAYRLITEDEWEYLARNKIQFGVEEMVGKYCEWTNTEFKFYPNAKVAELKKKYSFTPESNWRIYRGDSEPKTANATASDPITCRNWERMDYTFNRYPERPVTCSNISFRVASSASGN
jgi:eukaryotic-like serine/threonine-protein kinase